MPVEIMLLPRWFPFHLTKVSYWSRTVIVPLLVLMAKKPRARNPRGITHARAVRARARRRSRRAPAARSGRRCSTLVDDVLRAVEPLMPKRAAPARDRRGGRFRQRAAQWRGRARRHLSGDGERGDDVRLPRHAAERSARRHRAQSGAREAARARAGPRLLPALPLAGVGHRPRGACADGGGRRARRRRRRGAASIGWSRCRCSIVAGDWAVRRPERAAGRLGVPICQPALSRSRRHGDGGDRRCDRCDRRALSRADRARRRMDRTACKAAMAAGRRSMPTTTYYYLNYIPFADHGALLDPPTADVSARCVGLLGQLGRARRQRCSQAGIDYLRREQEADGSWFGRWGTNYIYGTWSVLVALNAAGVDENRSDDPPRRRVAARRSSAPMAAGARTARSYWPDQPRGEGKASTASQTAWALLALMAAGEAEHPAVARGVAFLLADSEAARALGRRMSTPPSVSRASSICAITAIAPISRSGRWRAIAISSAAKTPPIPTACR